MVEDSADDSNRVQDALGRARALAESSVAKVSAIRFNRTPAGRARSAHANGDTVFQHRMRLDDADHGALLSSIEAEGWELTDTQHVQETKSKSTAAGDSESETITYAIYLFRRSPTS